MMLSFINFLFCGRSILNIDILQCTPSDSLDPPEEIQSHYNGVDAEARPILFKEGQEGTGFGRKPVETNQNLQVLVHFGSSTQSSKEAFGIR